jgi:hypothetical protein
MTRHAAEAVEVAGIEPKQMSTGSARMSVMLSGGVNPCGLVVRWGNV